MKYVIYDQQNSGEEIYIAPFYGEYRDNDSVGNPLHSYIITNSDGEGAEISAKKFVKYLKEIINKEI